MNKQSLVYFNSKEKAINFALEYARNLEPQNDERLNKLATEIENEIHCQYYLAELIRKGVAYHVGYLPIHIRENIEDYFRKNIIKIIFCTSTLVEGVNLPADNLFVLSYKNGSTPMTSVEFKNMVGRVGRIGYNLYGNIFILRTDEKQKKDKYLELISKDVPNQELSLVTELSKNQKKLIVDSLIEGDVKLKHHPKDQSEDSYSLMRKFALILLNDIINDRKSIVYKEFESLLENKISIIKRNFGSSNDVKIDDDINISTDQSQSLIIAIKQGLKYPDLNEGRVNYTNLFNFLERLGDIFNWDFYEKSTLGFRNPDGVHSKLKWYAVTLSRWMSGYGLSNIISEAIEYKEETNGSTVKYQGRIIPYDRSVLHRNIVIADTLSIIDNIILFSCANYFLRFSTEYKRIHNIEEFDNDWYEYVEYGSTNPLTIFLQRNGFSIESSSYIKDNRKKYVVETEDGLKLSLVLLDCPKEAVKLEIQNMKYNFPNIFVE